jgi:hypothetical protein
VSALLSPEGCIPDAILIAAASAVPARSLANCSRAVQASSPPALRPAREVLRLSAIGLWLRACVALQEKPDASGCEPAVLATQSDWMLASLTILPQMPS